MLFELGGRREVQHVLDLGHHVHLAGAVGHIDALLGGDHLVAVEVGGPLLELGEVLDALERSLRAESRWMFTPRRLTVSSRWRKACGRMSPTQMVARVGVSVHVAVEAGYAQARLAHRRSSVWLNCCCGKGVTRSRRPSICLGLTFPLNSS